ncbi:ROK family protein [Kibdelosporangium philippinense]|uniref:ROK family protein n=1 Tax=Kibdelosporangium philippinense TaxID=211113 RepID=A0ABS8Z688_9PSEU|nr:ROK family protein [Kibdelosporangium philippinense]MCE7002156.1 ROK family protein [Kibdelosporangium philippinense]
MAKNHPTLALDIGGTWIRAATVTHDGQLLGAHKQATPTSGSPSEILRLCAQLADEARTASPVPPYGLGVSTTGPVNPRTGILYDPPNTPAGFSGLPLGPYLREQLGLTVAVDRDVNAAALAEQRFGAARGHTDFVYLTISTGIGAAVIADGELLRGTDGAAGELGHVVVAPDGPMCDCGRRGCLEAVASGPAIGRAADRHALANPGSGLALLRDSLGGTPLRGHHVGAAALNGDPDACEILAAAGAAVVSSVVDIVNVFNPQRVVLGGSVAMGEPCWIAQANAAVRQSALQPGSETARVVATELGDNGGLLGAALLLDQLA